jgi:hypothetical protein
MLPSGTGWATGWVQTCWVCKPGAHEGGWPNSYKSFVLHYSGGRWQQVALPAAPDNTFVSIWGLQAVTDDTVWAAGYAEDHNNYPKLSALSAVLLQNQRGVWGVYAS